MDYQEKLEIGAICYFYLYNINKIDIAKLDNESMPNYIIKGTIISYKESEKGTKYQFNKEKLEYSDNMNNINNIIKINKVNELNKLTYKSFTFDPKLNGRYIKKSYISVYRNDIIKPKQIFIKPKLQKQSGIYYNK